MIYTPLRVTQWSILIISQSAPNIQRKLQKVAMGPNTPNSQLVDISFGVFNNRDMAEEEKGDKKLKRPGTLLAVALQFTSGKPWVSDGPMWVSNPGPHRGTKVGPPVKLGPNQCAFYKKEGQLKRECPDHPQSRRATEIPKLMIPPVEED